LQVFFAGLFNIHIYIYVFVYICIYVYIYIFIYSLVGLFCRSALQVSSIYAYIYIYIYIYMYIYIYLYILSLVFCAKVSLVLVFLIRFFGRSLPEVSSAGLFLFSRSLSLQQVSFSSTGLFCRSLQQVFFVRLFTRFLYFFTRYASQVSSAGFVRISYFLPQRDPRKRHVPPTWECMCVCVCVYPRSLLIDTSRLKVSF